MGLFGSWKARLPSLPLRDMDMAALAGIAVGPFGHESRQPAALGRTFMV